MYEALEFMEKPKPKPKPKVPPKFQPKPKNVTTVENIQEQKGTPTSDAEEKANEAIRLATEGVLKTFDTPASKQPATPRQKQVRISTIKILYAILILFILFIFILFLYNIFFHIRIQLSQQ